MFLSQHWQHLDVFIDKSNRVARQRRRRSTREEDITSLDFEIPDRSDLPATIEEATLLVFLTNNKDYSLLSSSSSVSSSSKVDNESESESDLDDSSSSSSYDISPKKVVIKSNINKSQHHSHIRHSNNHRSKVQIIQNPQTVKLHVYQHDSQGSRTFLFNKDVTLPINSNSDDINKWIPLDLTSIARTWLQGNDKVLSIDIYCEMCSKYGISIINDASQTNNNDIDTNTSNNPALNVIGGVVRTKRKTNNNNRNKNNRNQDKENARHKKTHCRHNGEKKCCRHKWVIDFKEIGGYDYIIQPRHFDAGFCDGTCPFRHNMGSNHAYFQSLAHHQLKHDNVPNVCCAPTRLMDLEILHIDENDHTKLKVTTMKKMRAMKCSCT